MGNAEEGFPEFEDDLDFPADAVGGVNHLRGKNGRRDIGGEDGPFEESIIFAGMLGFGVTVVSGFSASLADFIVRQRDGDDPHFYLVRCAEKEFLIENFLWLLLEKLEEVDGSQIEVKDRGVERDPGDEIDGGGDHLGQDVQAEVSQIADDEIALAGDLEDVGGSGLIVTGIWGNGKAGEETGEEIVGELNFECGGLFLGLVARAGEEVYEGGVDGNGGAVDDPDIGEGTEE